MRESFVFCITEDQWYYNPSAEPNGLNYSEDQVKPLVLRIQINKSIMKGTITSACLLVHCRLTIPPL